MATLTPTCEHTIYTLAAEMMAAAASDADRARIDKALDLVSSVERTGLPNVWLVRSASSDAQTYHVTRYSCSCWDHAKRGGTCKHQHAVALFQQAERIDAEQSDPTPDEDQPFCPLHGDEECDWGCPGPSIDPRTVEVDADPYYCVLCEEPIPAAKVVETRWGFMHERCAASEPHDADADALRYELTGCAYLALVPTAALPNPIGTCTRLPMSARARALYSDLYPDDDSAA